MSYFFMYPVNMWVVEDSARVEVTFSYNESRRKQSGNVVKTFNVGSTRLWFWEDR